MSSDRLLGALGILLGAAIVWAATRIETGFIVDPLGPKAFPIIIGVVLVIASLYPLLRPDPEADWPPAGRLLEIAAAAVLLVGYALLLEPLGFVVATALAAGILSWRLGSKALWAPVSGVGISLGIYVVFHLILGLSLAKGPLGF